MNKLKFLLLIFLSFNVCANDWFNHATKTINANFNGNVSAYDSSIKDLLKFGRNENIGTGGFATIMTLNGTETNETYIQTNGINRISSSSALDTELITVEGHTIDGNGDLIFSIQTLQLNGQNKVSFTTPIARVSRAFNSNGTDLVGIIYVYEDTAIVAGEPTDDTKIHLMIRAGYNQSEKASTSISSTQWWVVTNVYADVLEKTAAFASIVLEVRQKGKVFRQVLEVGANTGTSASHNFRPFLIVPPNSDIRIRAVASANSTDVSAGIQGYLLTNK